MDSSICSSTATGADVSLSQSTNEPGDTTSSTIEGDKSTLESTEGECEAKLSQCVDRAEEERGDVISGDNDGSQGEDDMDICEESEDAQESSSLVEGERGGMESGPTISEIPIPSKLQRFYFESDTLALKNNPE